MFLLGLRDRVRRGVFSLCLGAILLGCGSGSPGLGAQEGGQRASGVEESPFAFAGRFVSRGELTTAPSARGNTAFLASADRRLYAVAPGGNILWRAELDGRAVFPAAVAPHHILVAFTDAGEFSLFDDRNGSLLKRFSLPGVDGKPPGVVVDPEGVVMVATGDGRLLAYSMSGSFLWTRDLSGTTVTPPLLHGGLLYVGTEGGILNIVSRGGRLIRRVRVSGELLQLLPAVSGGPGPTVLREDGTIVTYDGEGRLMSHFNLESEPLIGGFRRPNTLYLDGAGGILGLFSGGGVGRFGLGGEYLWGDREADVAIPVGSAVLLGSTSGRAELRAPNGRLLWELKSEEPLRTVAAMEDYFLVVYDDWAMSWYRNGGHKEGTPPGSRNLPEGEVRAPALYRELYRTGERSDRERLLTAIEGRTEEGRLAGSYRGIRSIVIAIALEPFRNPRYRGDTLLNNYPGDRARAATLLGRWGDFPSREALILLLRREGSSEPLLAALRGLERIPLDPNGETAAALLRVLERWPEEEAVVAAVLDVMRAIRSPLSEAGGEVLVAVATGAYSRRVRAEALEILRRFEKGR